jgi:hypothetical protein
LKSGAIGPSGEEITDPKANLESAAAGASGSLDVSDVLATDDLPDAIKKLLHSTPPIVSIMNKIPLGDDDADSRWISKGIRVDEEVRGEVQDETALGLAPIRPRHRTTVDGYADVICTPEGFEVPGRTAAIGDRFAVELTRKVSKEKLENTPVGLLARGPKVQPGWGVLSSVAVELASGAVTALAAKTAALEAVQSA